MKPLKAGAGSLDLRSREDKVDSPDGESMKPLKAGAGSLDLRSREDLEEGG